MASTPDGDLEPIQDYLAHSNAAARDGDVERLNAVLNLWECRITPEKITREEFREVLHEAIRENQRAAVSCLLSRGAELDHGRIAMSALHANAGIEMFQVFLDHGWNINCKDVTRRPFVQFCLNDRPLLQWLIDNSADLNARGDRWDTTTLDYATIGQPPSVLKYLISQGATLESSNPLHQVASVREPNNDRREVMAFLLDEAGVDINAVSTFGHRINKRTGDENGTPLHAAVRSGKEDNIMFLLNRGADTERTNVRGMTPLEYAKRYHFDMGTKILEQWAGNMGSGATGH